MSCMWRLAKKMAGGLALVALVGYSHAAGNAVTEKGQRKTSSVPSKKTVSKSGAPLRVSANSVKAVKTVKASKKPVSKRVSQQTRSVQERATRRSRDKVTNLKVSRHAAVREPSLPDVLKDGSLPLHSASALVIDQGAGTPVFEKNASAVLPIASITKLMTAMVVLDSQSSQLKETLTIGEDDVDWLRGSRSRLVVGAELTREDAILLALMSSENRAANALSRHYPGGTSAFVTAMNRKAQALGMTESRFEDPTGLSSNNVSTARDLAKMVNAAYGYSLIRRFSTTPEASVEVKGRVMDYNNTNALVKSSSWDIGVSKTGYISEAGKCLVMQARVAGRSVVIVLLDSSGKTTRLADANRIRRWMESASNAVGTKDS